MPSNHFSLLLREGRRYYFTLVFIGRQDWFQRLPHECGEWRSIKIFRWKEAAQKSLRSQ